MLIDASNESRKFIETFFDSTVNFLQKRLPPIYGIPYSYSGKNLLEDLEIKVGGSPSNPDSYGSYVWETDSIHLCPEILGYWKKSNDMEHALNFMSKNNMDLSYFEDFISYVVFHEIGHWSGRLDRSSRAAMVALPFANTRDVFLEEITADVIAMGLCVLFSKNLPKKLIIGHVKNVVNSTLKNEMCSIWSNRGDHGREWHPSPAFSIWLNLQKLYDQALVDGERAVHFIYNGIEAIKFFKPLDKGNYK